MKSNPTPSSRLSILLTALALILAPVASAQTSGPTFSKSFSPDTIGSGGVSTLQFTIGNFNSREESLNLAFTDTMPAAVTIATPANGTSTCGGTLSAPAGSTITFAGGVVSPGASCTVSVDVTSSTAGTHTNVSGDLTSDAGNSGNATANLTVAADRPAFTKSFSPSTVSFGGRSTLTLVIDNTAGSAKRANLRFTDNLPTGMVIASPTNASTDCGGGILTASAGGSVLSYGPLGAQTATVDAGTSCSVIVDVVANDTGVLSNTTGELTSTNQSGGDLKSSGTASADLTVPIEQLVLSKEFTDDPVAPGGIVTLEFTIRNADRRFSATSISFTDDLGAALSGLAPTGGLPSTPCGSLSFVGTVLSLTGGNLGPEGTCTFSVPLQVPSGAAPDSYTNTTNAITATIDGRPVTGNSAADVLFISAGGLELTKTFLNDPVGAGGELVLSFTITNSSTSEITDIAFSDVFVPELPTASVVPADGFCGTNASADYTPLINPPQSTFLANLQVSGASLVAGDSCTFQLTHDVALGAAGGFYDNTTSEITGTAGGETVTGDAASDDFLLIAAPTIVKEFIDDPVLGGATVTLRFTIAHGEGAPADALAIGFTDNLDDTLSGLVATGLPAAGICGAGSQIDGTSTLTFTGGTLAPGEECTFDVTLQVPLAAAAGAHTNTTSTLVATVNDTATLGSPAVDDLKIGGLVLTKEFTDDPVLPGGTVDLQFTVENVGTATATEISFNDNLDVTLDNLAASVTPAGDVCGTGSSAVSVGGGTVVGLSDGTLDPGQICTFTFTLVVPSGADPDTYPNATSALLARIDGSLVAFDNAEDLLTVVSDLLALSKEFTDDPVLPGGTVNLRFTITNLDESATISDIAFTDNLDDALSGLVALGLPAAACGGTLSGTGTLSLVGGSLGPAGSCTFDVTLQVPAAVDIGVGGVLNTTSQVTGTIGGLEVTGDPASDELLVNLVSFTKAFDVEEVDAGDTVTLTFTIQNLNASLSLSELGFSDDLNDMIPGLATSDLPLSGVCGVDSVVVGTSEVLLTDAALLPGGSCSFSIDMTVPANTPAGTYLNTTTTLRQGDGGAVVALPATDTLTVFSVEDSDGDGVLDVDDVCSETVIPENVPTRRLGVNRFALVDDDGIFDTTLPNGNGPGVEFTLDDTAGCSCEQIILGLGLGKGHEKFGCSLGAMRDWVALVNP